MIQELIRISSDVEDQCVIVFTSQSFVKSLGLSKGMFQRNNVLDFLRLEFDDDNLIVEHDELGAPYLIGRKEQVSISHSGNVYAVQIRTMNHVGVDVQVYKNDIDKGTFYFVNEEEAGSLVLSKENLHIIWAAKEATFKLLKGNVVRYKEDLIIVSINESIAKVKHFGVIYTFKFSLEDDFILIYTT